MSDQEPQAPVPQPSASGETTEGVVEISKEAQDIPTEHIDANLQQHMLKPEEAQVPEAHEIINEAHEAETAAAAEAPAKKSSHMVVVLVVIGVALLLLGVGVLAILSTSSDETAEDTAPATSEQTEAANEPAVQPGPATPSEAIEQSESAIDSALQEIETLDTGDIDTLSDDSLGI